LVFGHGAADCAGSTHIKTKLYELLHLVFDLLAYAFFEERVKLDLR